MPKNRLKWLLKKKAMEMLGGIARSTFLDKYHPKLTVKRAPNGRRLLYLFEEVDGLAKEILKNNTAIITNYELVK